MMRFIAFKCHTRHTSACILTDDAANVELHLTRKEARLRVEAADEFRIETFTNTAAASSQFTMRCEMVYG